MPFPVILGRYVQGAKVTCSMKVATPESEVLNLEQSTDAPPQLLPGSKASRRKKFSLMQQRADALIKSKVIEKPKMVVKSAERRVHFEEEEPAVAAAGEASSQVLVMLCL